MQNGREVFQRGVGPQTSIELQNLNAYLQEQARIRGTGITFEESTSETFDTHDAFHSFGSPIENMHDPQQPVEPESDDTDNIANPGLMLSSQDHTAVDLCFELMEDVEHIMFQQVENPSPEVMEEPFPKPTDEPSDNPFNLITPVDSVYFDPMYPMSVLGRLPFEEI